MPPLRLPTRTGLSLGSNSRNRICFLTCTEKTCFLFCCFLDVGLCSRALRSGRRSVQVGPSGHLYPWLPRKATFGDCQVKGSCEISRVFGAPAERWTGTAGAEPQNALSSERGAQHGELDDPVAQRSHQLSRNTQRSHRYCKHQSR